MKPTLVTGANGHVGNNVCRELVRRGVRVRAMMRASADPAPLDGLAVEIVRGEVTSAADVARAVEGCGAVHHTAAGFLMWARDPEREIIRPSIEGTRLVLEAARTAGVERVVYTSSGGTIGHAPSPDTMLDEDDFNEHPHTYYLQGKCAAEKEALAFTKQTGLPIVVVNPGLILGPRFWKLSESVRQVEQFLNRGAPAYFDGGFPVVDVEDVAVGMVLAQERGRSGERYILSGENVSVKQLFDLMSELTGIPAPKRKLPVPVLRLLAGGMELASKITRSRPMLDRSQVDEFAGKWGCLSNAKAIRELGMTFRNARETVARTVGWCLSHGFVKEGRRAAMRPHPALATLEIAR
jgi:dihydroflavonol-4-reductase